MFIHVRNRLEYVCSDGTAYDSKEEAENYEYGLIRERIYETQTKEIGEYTVYVLKGPEELEALKREDYGEMLFRLPEKITYPLVLGEISNDSGYYRIYKLLEEIINDNMNIISAMIEFMSEVK